MIAIGIDPGFANIGLSKYEFNSNQPLDGILRHLAVFHTKKANKKQNVSASSDNVRRGQAIIDFLYAHIDNKVSAICVESMSFLRNADSSMKVAMFWGTLIATAKTYRIPIIEESPQNIKQLVTGNPKATKEAVEKTLMRDYAEPHDMSLDAIKDEDRPHAWDSFAAIVAAIKGNDVMRSILQAARQNQPQA